MSLHLYSAYNFSFLIVGCLINDTGKKKVNLLRHHEHIKGGHFPAWIYPKRHLDRFPYTDEVVHLHVKENYKVFNIFPLRSCSVL